MTGGPRMAARNGAIRGTRIGGAHSLENRPAHWQTDTVTSTYRCQDGHDTAVRYSVDADTTPTHIACSTCFTIAAVTSPGPTPHAAPAPTLGVRAISPWQYLTQRRSSAQLDRLLADALRMLRATGQTFGVTGGTPSRGTASAGPPEPSTGVDDE